MAEATKAALWDRLGSPANRYEIPDSPGRWRTNDAVMAYASTLKYCCGVSPGEMPGHVEGPAAITNRNYRYTESNIFKFVRT